MGHSKISLEREVHSSTSLLQKTKKKKMVTNYLTLQLKELEKEQQENPSVSRRKEIIKIRAEINDIETKETIHKINKTKSWFFKRINKIDEPLARLTKKQREWTQINKLEMKEVK